MLNFESLGDNGYGYRHWEYTSKLVCVTIQEDIEKNTFEVNIHPNVDKGYRDPYEVKTFKSLDECKIFATNFLKED